ncbi:protein spinster homolog 1-like isoform X3 [Mizuhopecten yessoensis]|uniref:protein spinster homolog 1-like isoform X3 n=1 Tax=Mizuhopecten yessoensis TaxID=6573 RepID=UPI000B45C503|nr:protein spinster homolog 1-like isoform X3 [Mizuhopecten yessoensis]
MAKGGHGDANGGYVNKGLELEEVKLGEETNTAPIVDEDGNRRQSADSEVPNHVVVESRREDSISNATAYGSVSILLCINLLNYMDRYTVAGVLKDIQDFYGLENSEDGLIQTVFVLTYMVFSPIFGFLGDRYTRKYIMAGGIFFWATVTFAGSMIPKEHFFAFAIMRALVGVGEASYSTIAPTIIADLFTGEKRSRMLMIFYFAIPVGSGMGYIVGSNVAKALGAWQWALRVTPVLGLVCVVLILVVLKEPKRGMSEGGVTLQNTSYFTDLKEVVKIKSFVLSTIGFTCVAFTTGALALWAPLFMYDSIMAQGKEATQAGVAFTFGIITVVAGFVGVALGAEISRRYKKINPRADPLVCAFGLITCVPFLFFALVLSQWYTVPTWILIFLGETMLCLNWSIIADMLLYVVIPTRRSTAESVQILISHAFGDAGSPYIVGLVSDALSKNYNAPSSSSYVQFKTLQTALYVTPFICVLGGGFFLATALFIEKDKNAALKITQAMNKAKATNGGITLKSIGGEDEEFDFTANGPTAI